MSFSGPVNLPGLTIHEDGISAAELIPEAYGGRVSPMGHHVAPPPVLYAADGCREPPTRPPHHRARDSNRSAGSHLSRVSTHEGPQPTHHVTSMGSRTAPPPGTPTVNAPLSIVRKHSSIKGCYSVSLEVPDGSRGREPDIRLETRDDPIDTTLYLTGPLEADLNGAGDETHRTARIDIRTAATVRLRLQRGKGVKIDASVATTKSRIHLWLPNEFDGLLTIHSRKSQLSPILREAASLRPAPGDASVTYAISLRNSASATAVPEGAEGREPGPDRIFAHAHGTVRVYTHIDEEEGGKCLVA